MPREALKKGVECAQAEAGKERDGPASASKDRELVSERNKAVGMDLGL